MTTPAMNAKAVVELRARIGEEFDGELHLSEAEALSLFALIAQQADEIERLRSAMAPFAAIADDYPDQEDDDFQVWRDFDVLGATLPLRIFRRARAALSPVEKEKTP